MQLWLLDSLMDNKWINALSWTFMHSLWLGLLASVLAASIIAFTRTARPGMRSNLLCVVLLLFVSAIIATFCIEYFDSKTDLEVSTISPIQNADELHVTNTSDLEPALNSGGALTTLNEEYEANASHVMFAWVFFFG